MSEPHHPVRDVVILLFDDVEVLDFAGPFEVFAVTGRTRDTKPFNVYTVGEKQGPIIARGGLSVNPDYTLENCPPPDILVVPGGFGTRSAMRSENILSWIRQVSGQAELVLSVCTGSLVLGSAGLLDGLGATTHYGAYDLLRQVAPQTRVMAGQRYVDNGRLITAAGVSAGIDMALHIVARLLGKDEAHETAHYIEYDYWQPQTGS